MGRVAPHRKSRISSLASAMLPPMKPDPKTPEKDFGKDLRAFERLPAKTKELLILQERTEKSTGQESVDLQKLTQEKSKQRLP